MKCKLFILLLVILLIEYNSATTKKNDNRRPLYVIASMVNTIEELEYYLSKGANGVEVDVAFDKQGNAKYMYESWPCVCHRRCGKRTDIHKYLEYARDITKPAREQYKPNFVLLYLDLHTNKLPANLRYRAGKRLAQIIIDNLFEAGTTTSRLRLQLSITYAEDYEFIIGFEDEMDKMDIRGEVKSKIGWDVGLNDDLITIDETWKKVKTVHNLWIGDGISNCFWWNFKDDRLKKVLEYKNTCRSALNKYCPQKSFIWVIDQYKLQRVVIKLGADVIFTNKPGQLKHIIENEFNNTHRIANRLDNPWSKYIPNVV